jgi:hypothetical protein
MVRSYIQQRKAEILKKSNDEGIKSLLVVGWNFIEDRFAENYTQLTPEVTRKIEIMEVLFSNFITHGLDLNKLNEIEEQIKDVGAVTGRTFQ